MPQPWQLVKRGALLGALTGAPVSVRQIELHIKIMVNKAVILLWIKNLKKG